MHCGRMWYSTETTENKSTKGAVAEAKAVTPKRSLTDRIKNYFASTKSVCVNSNKQHFIYELTLLIILADHCRPSGVIVRPCRRSIESHGVRR